MPKSDGYALTLTRKILRVLMVLNPIFAFLILVLLIASLIWESWVMTALGVKSQVDSARLIFAMRTIMVLGIAAAPLVQVVLKRLMSIVESVDSGNPFVILNAERLKTIAWSLVGLEVIHFVIIVVAKGASSQELPIDVDLKFSASRWLAVLLCFVLARVFEQGAKMRDDLEGTI